MMSNVHRIQVIIKSKQKTVKKFSRQSWLNTYAKLNQYNERATLLKYNLKIKYNSIPCYGFQKRFLCLVHPVFFSLEKIKSTQFLLRSKINFLFTLRIQRDDGRKLLFIQGNKLTGNNLCNVDLAQLKNFIAKNPLIYNILCLIAWTMGQTNHRPRV